MQPRRNRTTSPGARNGSKKLDGRPSRLDPLWYAGSFLIGMAAGLPGDRVTLGFVAETERQVEAHLDDHLSRLPDADARSAAILEQMSEDEARHGTSAELAGGAPLPGPVRRIMGPGGRPAAQFLALDLTRGNSLEAALGLDPFVRGSYFLGFLLGHANHRLRQPSGNQLVRMMLVHQATIRGLDLPIAGAGLHAENAIGLLQADKLAASATHAGLLCPHQRLDLRQLDPPQPQCAGNLPQGFPLGPVDRTGRDRRLHLNLHEGPRQVRPVMQLAAQPIEGVIQRIAGLLARGKMLHGAGDLRGRQLHPVHDQARRANLRFRDPPVGFGDMTHDGERGLEEVRLDALRRKALRLP